MDHLNSTVQVKRSNSECSILRVILIVIAILIGLVLVAGIGYYIYASMTSFRYVTYIRGNGNVILAAPHGGWTLVKGIPLRHDGHWDGERCDYRWDCRKPYSRAKCYSSIIQDIYTREITANLAKKLETLTGQKPYVILLNVHRRNVDVNRPKDEGTASVPLAEKIYDEFHNSIKQARRQIRGPGLFLEIHGHTHNHTNSELGYRIPNQDLNRMNFTAEETSIRNLAKRLGNRTTIQELVWGATSLGALMENEGIQSLPSPRMKVPGKTKYFRGGYDTLQYGSLLGGQIDGIQIELPLQLRNQSNVNKVSKLLSQAISEYWRLYYNI